MPGKGHQSEQPASSGFLGNTQIPLQFHPTQTSKAEAEMARNKKEEPGLPRSPQSQLLFKGLEF